MKTLFFRESFSSTKFLFSLGLGLGALASISARANDACAPSAHACSYYACVEERVNCGAQEYLRGFAMPYCEKYLGDETSYTPQGSLWLQEVRLCLQEELRDITSEEGIHYGQDQCRELESLAVASHRGCYLQTGYCDLPWEDRRRVIATAWKAAFKPKYLYVFLQIHHACQQR